MSKNRDTFTTSTGLTLKFCPICEERVHVCYTPIPGSKHKHRIQCHNKDCTLRDGIYVASAGSLSQAAFIWNEMLGGTH